MFTKPALLLRIEGAVAFGVSILLYGESHTSWILFAVLFLSPDLFMLGYLVNTRIGAAGEQVPSFAEMIVRFCDFGFVSHQA